MTIIAQNLVFFALAVLFIWGSGFLLVFAIEFLDKFLKVIKASHKFKI